MAHININTSIEKKKKNSHHDVIGCIVHPIYDVGKSLSVGTPKDEHLVELIVLLELADIAA